MTDDMFPPFTTLLSQLQNIISQSPQPTQTSRAEAEELIVNTFNNDETSGPIVYLMRLFAGSRLRDEADRFVPFLEGFSSADDFCKSVIEPVSAEIEHIGITCLCETLMQPLGFAVEIIYLDRSPNELNTFVFRDENEPEKETVRSYLLYRPGHYDILYKDDGYAERQRQVQEAAARARDIQVHRAAFSPQAHGPSPMRNMSFGGVYDLGALSAIPGMSMLGITPSVCAAAPSYTSYTTYQPIMSPTYGLEQPMAMPIPVSVPSNVKLEMEAHTHSPNVTTPPSGYQVQNQGMGINNISAPIPLPVRSLSIGSVEMMTPTLGNPSQFRHSKYELETKYRSELGGGNLFIPSRVEDVEGCMGNGNGAREAQTLQTSMFRNSHYNTAHYNNPNFQPEEYNPGEDGWEVSGGVGGGRGRRKRSAS